LFEFICKSLGSNLEKLNITDVDQSNENKILLRKFVESINAKLAMQRRQWVFIFDQINKLFIRFPGITDISALPFPFYYMYLITKRGRITTIISASANNEISHRDRRDGFLNYDHCHSFTDNELLAAFPILTSFDDEVINSIKDTTGKVPLQVQELLSRHEVGAEVPNFEEYELAVNYSIKVAVGALKDQIKKQEYVKELTQSTCCCLLQVPLKEQPQYYDRKYSVLSKDVLSKDWYLRPLFPLVSSTYRDYFGQHSRNTSRMMKRLILESVIHLESAAIPSGGFMNIWSLHDV